MQSKRRRASTSSDSDDELVLLSEARPKERDGSYWKLKYEAEERLNKTLEKRIKYLESLLDSKIFQSKHIRMSSVCLRLHK